MVRKQNAGKIIVICGPMFCHRAGQLILMADGRILPVESIQIGDRVMGPDGPRLVLALHTGISPMCQITPARGGDPFVVTLDHVLTLTDTPSHPDRKPSEKGGRIVDVSVREWLNWSKWKKSIFKLFRVGVPYFDAPDLDADDIDPYFLGLLLGDGTITDRIGITSQDSEIFEEMDRQAAKYGLRVSCDVTENHCENRRIVGKKNNINPIALKLRELGLYGATSGNKFIPAKYKTSSFQNRLQILAGLMDTDGSLTNGAGFDYISKSKKLAEDVAFVARSVGFAVTFREKENYCQTGGGGIFYRVYIGGNISTIPVRVPRKKSSRIVKHRPTISRFDATVLPEEPFFGFSLDGNGRYLLGDFTVTHNSGKTEELMRMLRREEIGGRNVFLFKHSVDVRSGQGMVASHSGRKMEAIEVSSASGIRKIIEEVNMVVDVVGVDEAQFFDSDLILEAELLAQHGTIVILSGLDQDYSGNPFGPIPYLMARADEVQKLNAVCMKCGEVATKTCRIVPGTEQIIVGAKDKYEARCRACWLLA